MLEWFEQINWHKAIHIHEWFNMSREDAHNHLGVVALETLLIIIAIMLIIELAGRKAVAGLTTLQFVITISIGEAILLPVIDKDFHFFKTIVVVAVMVLFLVVTEYLELKFNWIESFLSHKAKVIFEKDELNVNNLKKTRFTVDQLEMELRNLGVERFDDCEIITVEANGKLGFKLKEGKKPVTREEFIYYMDERFKELFSMYLKPLDFDQFKNSDDIFKEVSEKIKQHKKHPKYLK